jgi:hypothetical protein
MISPAQPEEHKGRLKALHQAFRLLREHFDVGFIVVSHEESGLTRFAKAEWGNRFAVCALSKDFAEGDLEPEDTTPSDEEEDA